MGNSGREHRGRRGSGPIPIGLGTKPHLRGISGGRRLGTKELPLVVGEIVRADNDEASLRPVACNGVFRVQQLPGRKSGLDCKGGGGLANRFGDGCNSPRCLRAEVGEESWNEVSSWPKACRRRGRDGGVGPLFSLEMETFIPFAGSCSLRAPICCCVLHMWCAGRGATSS